MLVSGASGRQKPAFGRLKAPGPKKRPKKANFTYFLVFFGPGTGPRGFSRPWHRISRQKCRIWMRMCRVTGVFAVSQKFGTLLVVLKLNFQAVIKSAASAASRKTRIQDPGEPTGDGSAGGRRKRLGSPGFLDFGLREGCASSRLDHSLKV